MEPANVSDTTSLAGILGPWIEPDINSGLIARCREAWNKPLRELSRQELATLLRQKFAVKELLPVARKKLQQPDDNTEMFEGELVEAITYASN
jgi:hypothetical protein